MSDDIFATPPMSGNVPYKDLEQEMEVSESAKTTLKPEVSEVDKKTKTLKMYIIGLAIALGFIIIILLIILVMLANRPTTTITATPSPVPSPSATPEPAIPQTLKDRLNNLEKQSKEADLKELNLSYPQVDWRIAF
jgi:hypothetical protein